MACFRFGPLRNKIRGLEPRSDANKPSLTDRAESEAPRLESFSSVTALNVGTVDSSQGSEVFQKQQQESVDFGSDDVDKVGGGT